MADLVEALRDPAAYPHPAHDPVVHHTHISVVFLAGDFAYKIKKPVRLGFLDYGTPERRLHFCREEVRLNRRLAPDVYLGVVPVVEGGATGGVRVLLDAEDPVDAPAEGGTGDVRVPEAAGVPGVAAAGPEASGAGETGAPHGGDAAVGPPVPGGGRVLEWAVRMRRLPPERTLGALLEVGALGRRDLERLGEHLAAFHARARRDPEVAGFARFERVAGNARDNLTHSRDQVGDTLHEEVFRRLSEALERTLEEVRPLVEARAERGVPCETHGDLRLDHVYFLEGDAEPTVVDCIEFNPAFRYADPVADMAFLAMDLQQAGRWEAARAFADAWFRATGDDEGRALLPFYLSYRAAVRGKVQGIKAADAAVPEAARREAARTATGHWLLSLGALAPPGERPGLVLVGGLPGAGKSTVARALAESSGFRVVRSDVVRKELAGLDLEAPAADAWGRGIYTAEWSDRTYAACRERAREELLRGGRVVVDASFHAEERRRSFVDLGRRLGVRVVFLHCRIPGEVARRRLAEREGDASDADREVHARMSERWEEAGDEVARVTALLSSEGSPEETAAAALEALRARGLHGEAEGGGWAP